MSAEYETNELLALTRKAAAAGGQVLAGRNDSAFNVDEKSGAGDWVTDFDRAAEDSIREVITAARPNDEISGEEYGKTTPQEPSGFRWSIDPLDGTANFIRNIVYYGSSVGVTGPDGSGGQAWLAGSIVAPALGVEYFAARGQGAYKLHLASGVITRLQYTGPAKDRILATGFGYDAKRRAFQTGVLEDLLPGFVNVRRIGSAALDLCMVADGTMDAYAEYGTHEYDWAAGALIAEEAGLPVGRPTTYPGWQWAGELDTSVLVEES